jgi:KDO2-lipid IV(A) lauroyltransferase
MNARHLPEYLLLRTLELVVTALPRTWALSLGGFVGSVVCLFGPRRDVVRKNMRHVGGWSEAEMKRVIRRLYRNMGRYAADILRPSRREPPHDFDNMAILERHLARGKGIVALLAHFGNWEALASIFGPKVPLHVVAQPMRNRMVQRWLARKRASTRVTEIYLRKALRKILTALRENHVVAILADQYGRRDGTMVPFLGKDASTVRTVAAMHHKTDCSVFLAFALLRDDNTYEIHVEEDRPIAVPRENADEFIAVCQRQHNDVVSSWIRAHPDHYFGWFHRRFRESVKY